MSEIQEALVDLGYDCRSYSGRGMYGKTCLAVTLDSTNDLWNVAQTLAARGVILEAPKTDGMGRSIVAYWPGVEFEKFEEEDDDDED